MRHISRSAAETVEIGVAVGKNAKPGDIFCLSGELGAGKTEFARGIAMGVGFPGQVQSPTFNLLNVYEGGRHIIYHFDFYRLDTGTADMSGIGVEDYLYADGICIIEWPHKLHESFFIHATKISLTITNNSREIIIT